MLGNTRYGCTLVVKTGVCDEKQTPVSIPLTFVSGALVPSPTVCRIVRERRLFPISVFQTGFDYSIFFCGGPVPVVADFEADATSGDAPLDVQFTDLSTGDPTSWAWDFGDGGTSTEQNPAHTYADAGTYTVELVATNADGSDTATKTDYIVADEPNPIQAPANINVSPGDGNNTVDFEGDLGFTNRYSFWTITGGEPAIIDDWTEFTSNAFNYPFNPDGAVYLYIEVGDENGNWSDPGIANVENSSVGITTIGNTPGNLTIDVEGDYFGLLESFEWHLSNDNFDTDDNVSDLTQLVGSINTFGSGNFWVRLIGTFASGSTRQTTAGPVFVPPNT